MGYTAAIIGCGYVGVEAPDSHSKAYMCCPETELVGLCDTEFKLDCEDSLFRIKYTDFHQMVKELKPDIVSICTPPSTHADIVWDVAPMVQAIYLEKPIATTLEDADRIINRCNQFGVILQVNHQRRFIEPKLRFSRGILNNGTHAFDLLRKTFGDFGGFCSGKGRFGDTWVEIEYVDTEESIFELDLTRSKERMILRGVNELVACLELNTKPLCTGEDGREALRLALLYEELSAPLNLRTGNLKRN